MHPRQRDRSAASLGSEHQNPSRIARKPILPRASSASAGPIPRSAPYAKRSGIGPKRALEAITKIPSRTARKPHPPQSLLSARRLGPAKPKPSHPPSKPHHQKKRTDCLKKEPPEQRTLGQPLSQPTLQAHRMNSPHSALTKTNATMTAWLPLEIPTIPVRRAPLRDLEQKSR